MAKLTVTPGATSRTLDVFIMDSTSTTGAGKTGLAYNTSGLSWYYIRQGDSSATSVTLADATVGTFTSGGFKEISSTNMPGWYQIGCPDAAIAAGATSVKMQLKGATGMAPVNLEIQLSADGNTLQTAIGNIATTGAPSYAAATSFTKTVGGTETNSYTNTTSQDGVYHQIPDSGGALDVYYEFALKANEIGISIEFKGRMNGAGDNVVLQTYDWIGTAWVTQATITGTSTTNDTSLSRALVGKFTGTGANLGKVRIRFYAASGLTSATLYVDQIITGKTANYQSAGYANGKIWIDTNSSNTGTTAYVDGTVERPVNSIANAISVAGATGLRQFYALPGSSITLGAAFNDYDLDGSMWTLDFNGKDVSRSGFHHAEQITGSALTSGIEFKVMDSHINVCTLTEVDVYDCALCSGAKTLNEATSYFFDKCWAVNISGSWPTINFNSLGGASVIVSHWSGELNITNMASGDVLVIDGDGRLNLAASCASGSAVTARGNINISNSGGGTITDHTTRATIWEDTTDYSGTPGTTGYRQNQGYEKIGNIFEWVTPRAMLAAPGNVDYSSVVLATDDPNRATWPIGFSFKLQYRIPGLSTFSNIGVLDRTGWTIDPGAGSILSEDGGAWYVYTTLPDGTPNPGYPTIPAGRFTLTYTYGADTKTAYMHYSSMNLTKAYVAGICYFFPAEGDIGILWSGGFAEQDSYKTSRVGSYATGMSPAEQVLVNTSYPILTNSSGYTYSIPTSTSPGGSQYL